VDVVAVTTDGANLTAVLDAAERIVEKSSVGLVPASRR